MSEEELESALQECPHCGAWVHWRMVEEMGCCYDCAHEWGDC